MSNRSLSNRLVTHELWGDAGEVVLLLNGGMMTYASWAPVSAGLLDDYRVLGCDFQGQMMSPGDGYDRLEDHVDDLVALLDALGLGSVHVLGTSFGGEISVLLAAAHPSRVRSLAVVTAVDRTPPGMAESARDLADLARQAATGNSGPFHDTLLQQVYSSKYIEAHAEELAARRQQELPPIWYQGLLGILASIADFDLSDAMARITCPTLVVHAAKDTVMPEERVAAVAQAIREAELRVHPTSGHGLVSEDPGWLVETYRHFLDRLDA